MPTTEKIYPEYIRLDGGTQPRAKIDEQKCAEYGERMKAGDRFPAVDVYFDGENYWLADGFHRHQAQVMALPGEPMECNVYQGTVEDAQWHSYGVNKTHGLPRSNEDKKRAVKAALVHRHGTQTSDRQIAEHVGVHFDTVTKYRRELERQGTIGKSDSRTGRDGRTIKTTNIGNTPRSPSAKSNGRKPRNGISPKAHKPRLGHSKPCPMIAMQFSPNNPQTAAATLWQLFDRPFIESLVQDLTQRLQNQGEDQS